MKNAIEETVEMTREESAFIERFTAAYCRPHQVVVAERLASFVAARQMRFLASAGSNFAFAAGDSAPTASVEAPDEEVRFVFVSEGEADADGAWRAELTVPPKAGTQTMLTLVVTDNPFWSSSHRPIRRATQMTPHPQSYSPWQRSWTDFGNTR